jgi:hypothetical protein
VSQHYRKSTGRYDDGGFALDKHAELDSYSAGTLKQQSTGRYDDDRFVLEKHATIIISTCGLLLQ